MPTIRDSRTFVTAISAICANAVTRIANARNEMPGQPENVKWGAVTTDAIQQSGRLNPTGTKGKGSEPKPSKLQRGKGKGKR